jgi:hypothetical protein
MKKLFSIVLLVVVCMWGSFADMFKLSENYRPVRKTIYWAEYEEAREHTDYEYNKKGELVRSSMFRSGESPDWYSTFEYDENGNLVKKTTYSSSGISGYTTYIYREGNLHNETEYDSNNTITRQVLYEYDEKGKLMSVAVKEVPYDGKNLEWNKLELYVYNAGPNPAETYEYYNGSLDSKTTYTYDKNSVVSNEIWYGDVKNIIAKTILSYVYHEKGKLKNKLKEMKNSYFAIYDGEEHLDCCTTYSMKAGYDEMGNMTTLTYFNCENNLSGTAVIEWEKGKTDVRIIIREIFERLHWYFTGC